MDFIKALLITLVVVFIVFVATNQIFQWDCENLAEKIDYSVEWDFLVCWVEIQPNHWVRKENIRFSHLLEGE